jgi:hypothetical protein
VRALFGPAPRAEQLLRGARHTPIRDRDGYRTCRSPSRLRRRDPELGRIHQRIDHTQPSR